MVTDQCCADKRAGDDWQMCRMGSRVRMGGAGAVHGDTRIGGGLWAHPVRLAEPGYAGGHGENGGTDCTAVRYGFCHSAG